MAFKDIIKECTQARSESCPCEDNTSCLSMDNVYALEIYTKSLDKIPQDQHEQIVIELCSLIFDYESAYNYFPYHQPSKQMPERLYASDIKKLFDARNAILARSTASGVENKAIRALEDIIDELAHGKLEDRYYAKWQKSKTDIKKYLMKIKKKFGLKNSKDTKTFIDALSTPE